MNNADSKSKSKTASRGRLLLIAMAVLLLIAWLVDTPARLCCALAESALVKNQPHAALTWITRARSLSQNQGPAVLLAVRAHLQLNKSQTAAQLLEQAARYSVPLNTLDAYRHMVAAQAGDRPAADALLASQTDVSLPTEAYEAIVRCAYLQGDFKRASLVLDELERSNEAPATVRYLRGRQCEILDDYPGALENYTQSLKANPRVARAAFRAGRCLHHQRSFEQASTMFRQLESAPYQLIAAIEVADCLLELGQVEQASQQMQALMAADPRQVQSRYLELDEYVDSDRAAMTAARLEDARENSEPCVHLLERVLAFNHRDFEARALLIKHLRLLQRTAEADKLAAIQNQMVLNRQRCREIRQQLDGQPNNMDLRCELADLYWQTESEAEARLLLEETLQLDPQCTRAMELLSKINAESQSGGR